MTPGASGLDFDDEARAGSKLSIASQHAGASMNDVVDEKLVDELGGTAAPDGVETGTGVFVNASDTGTRADLADSDGDGYDDPVEVAQGTDPNDPLDHPGAPPIPVPALSGWGIALLVAGMLASAVWTARRRKGLVEG